ncbi:hypothetical protein FSP39_017370 [Pinctada imbricata]|uniref:5'-3' exoribonuclease 1 n=1 Tax=Pinctada imbricata TaxID=66713 RepID=A0AA88YTH6_PINIB|nr:hypothetical protein FSP39_017370 [Pinctada imbricata]
MGVPKFYRWISERYPCLSEVVKEFQIPEFDNLYLDMNGIIHVCSHPDDGNPHFRITEEKIFRDIFHYLEFLFRMIKPRKVFFMAIDGVAPRAKMNQQRGRRFRSAREAEELERKARESGEVLPTEKRFDSNCITPGTEFMVRLQEQLKYFVTSKISNDPLWHAVDVYLSGHETPGEGEHKIMDFIRQQKSEPSYDPNTRHCLYGLDADLIMLGLTSHEPHFSLLREEVRFGGHKDKNKRPATPEETTFHLLHLSLMREYLDFEFESLKDSLPFGYDLEKIIDDWVLMGFLVGNDFIPHLPHLHIQHDALPLLWKTYMNILPECGGYLNDGGHLNLERFEQYMKELAKFDIDKFEETFSDLKWLETKIEGKAVNMEAANVADEIKARKMRKENANKFAALQDTEEDGLGDEFLPTSQKVSAATTPITPDTPDSDDEDDINTFDEEFTLHKKHYYMTKMEYENVDKEVLRDQSEGYIRAIQWILLYYYEGVPSWSWFYPHHYAPYISDVTDFKDMNIEFDLSTPFLPFQQLMAVLPAASKELLPEPYQKLMTQDYSPVIDFYPINFQTDLNGKQQDWEAVVLIPFIDENRLLDAMRTVESKLSDPEKKRNSHGPCLLYNYSKEELEPYPSSLPGVFPDIVINHARLTKIPLDAFLVDKKKLWKGLLPGVKLDVYFPGFPTLKHLPHRAFLKKDGVKVFQHCSKNENMLLEILSEDEQVPSLSTVASEYVGKTIYVAWPHLYEAKVISVADREERFVLVEESGHKSGKSKRETKYNIQREPLGEDSAAIWCSQIKSLTDRYKDRLGIIVGDTYYILNVQPMIGRKYICGSHGVITHEKQFSKDTVPFLLQTTVKDIAVHDPAFCQFKTLRELFPVKEMVFMLGWPHYGGQGEVMDTEEGESPRVRINVIIPEEPKLDKFAYNSERYSQQFFPGYIAAQRAGISSHFLSRITGSIFVKPGSADNPQEGHNINIGLNMKFTKRSEEMPGYTKQTTDGWTYSQKAISTVSEYMQRFPEIVEYISNNDRNKGDVFYEEDLFGDTGVTLKQVQDYLKSLPIAQIKTQKTGTDNLDEGIIKAIEQEVDRVQDINRKGKRVKMQVKPHLLFRPIIGQGGQVPDLSAKYYLFDRVVNVRNGYSVPFGLRGTVVGIHKGEKESDVIYEVVFDEAFQGGLTIRCSEGRGYRVPPAALINITYGERKNGARADPVASQQNSYERTQNYHTSQPQYPRQGSYNQNAWQQGQSSRGYNEVVTNDYNRQGSYSNFKNRNDNRAFYNENYHNDYDEDYNYAGYDTSNRKRQQYDKNVNVRSPRGKNQHDKNPGVMGSPRGNQQNQRQAQKESVHKHPGANENQPDKTPATKPDSLNLRQQSFDGSESAAPPMFVTPKISPGRRDPRRDSGGGGQSKIYHDTHNSEFANMWKELQTGANESGKAPSGGKDENKGPTLLQAAESLPKVPSPVVNHSETVESKKGVKEEKKTVTLDSLFKEASKVKSEEDQFAAMFKSLQISAEKKEETTKPAQNHGIVEVTRKTPQKRRDSESESRSVNPTETKSHKSQDKEVKSVVRNILPENTVTVNHSDKSEHVRNDVSCDEATLQTSNNKQTEEVKTPSKSERHVKEGSHTPSNKQPGKRRTRIAANFNFGGN